MGLGEDEELVTVDFWAFLLNFENSNGDKVYSGLAKHVLRLLSIPLSNATVERFFSLLTATKTKVRNRLSLEVLNSLLILRNCPKCCRNSEIFSGETKNEMSRRFNSLMYTDSYDHREVQDSGEEQECFDILHELLLQGFAV